MSQFPPPQHAGHLKLHRGALVLTMGILGFLCFIFAIVAWVMGKNDLREMDAGVMDPEGRSLTQVGYILGIVFTALAILGILLNVILIAVGGGLAFMGSGAGP